MNVTKWMVWWKKTWKHLHFGQTYKRLAKNLSHQWKHWCLGKTYQHNRGRERAIDYINYILEYHPRSARHVKCCCGIWSRYTCMYSLVQTITYDCHSDEINITYSCVIWRSPFVFDWSAFIDSWSTNKLLHCLYLLLFNITNTVFTRTDKHV